MTRPHRIDELRAKYREYALQRGVNPRDVDVLLADLLSQSVGWLFAHGEELVDPHPLDVLLARRFAGEPLQYIRGRADFFGREFQVDRRVLIPRPETELLVEAALERGPAGASVIDIGTGSGCIAISLNLERSDLRVFAIDRSLEALTVAAGNQQRLGSSVRFAASDLLTATRGSFDLIVSNPPYVPLAEYGRLAVEVRIHEPRMALTPGVSGMERIEDILDQATSLLAPHGCVILEVGHGQEETVREAAVTRHYAIEDFLPDLAGIPRVVVLSRDGRQR